MDVTVENIKFKDHFSQNTAAYAAFRPSYPIDLVNTLADLCPGTERVLDCGCGTGQLSVLLAQRFSEVIATDASAMQIENAQACEGVTYRTALAEQSELTDHSADLITVAQAAHWLDLDRFYQEVHRIAKPNAILAFITYGVLHVDGEVAEQIQQFYYQTIADYWPAERKHVEDGYQNLAFPFPEIQLAAIDMDAFWNLDQLMGYLKTWSAVKEAEKIMGFNPVDRLRTDLSTVWGDPETKKKVTWPLSIRAGRINSR